ILRMDVLGPELRIVAHLPRQIASSRFQALTDEPTRKAIQGLRGGVNNRRTSSDERLQVIDDCHALNRSRAAFSSVARSSRSSSSRLRSRESLTKPIVPVSSPLSSERTEAEIRTGMLLPSFASRTLSKLETLVSAKHKRTF